MYDTLCSVPFFSECLTLRHIRLQKRTLFSYVSTYTDPAKRVECTPDVDVTDNYDITLMRLHSNPLDEKDYLYFTALGVGLGTPPLLSHSPSLPPSLSPSPLSPFLPLRLPFSLPLLPTFPSLPLSPYSI